MKEEWIKMSERVPTKADADEGGCVIVWHDYNGAMVYRASAVTENRFIRWWMPCPAKPQE